MRNIARLIATVASFSLFGLLAAGSSRAAADDAEYGQHVRDCAQVVGFTGTHNPGMHQGRSSWDPGHTCDMP